MCYQLKTMSLVTLSLLTTLYIGYSYAVNVFVVVYRYKRSHGEEVCHHGGESRG